MIFYRNILVLAEKLEDPDPDEGPDQKLINCMMMMMRTNNCGINKTWRDNGE